VQSGHFYDPVHGRILTAIKAEFEAGRPVSPVTIRGLFGQAPLTPDVTIGQYLGRLAVVACPPFQIDAHVKHMVDLATRRGLLDLAGLLADKAADTTRDEAADALLLEAEQALYALAPSDRYGAEALPFRTAVAEALARAQAAAQRGNSVLGVPSGLTELDERLGGFQPGELVIIAGRPGMGKSALATGLAFDSAMRGLPATIYSLEMTAEQLATRLLADRLALSSDALRRGRLDAEQLASVERGAREIADIPLLIDESGGLTMGQLAARARRQKRLSGTGLIVVDYLQLMRGSRPGRDGRTQEVAEITTGLKALAKELSVPVVALSQLNRAVETRNDKRPMLADLRESGSIEQDADAVLFVYREEYYLERERPDMSNMDAYADWDTRYSKAKGQGEIIIGKSRHSGIGTVRVGWNGAQTRFYNLGEPR
jgi:replicative DNA helicase